jgi:hypothetical protein
MFDDCRFVPAVATSPVDLSNPIETNGGNIQFLHGGSSSSQETLVYKVMQAGYLIFLRCSTIVLSMIWAEHVSGAENGAGWAEKK